MGLRKVNTKGIKQANKVMQMAAIAYNLKKYLKFTNKIVQTNTQRITFCINQIKGIVLSEINTFIKLTILRKTVNLKIQIS